jgi:hypothetical protein
VCSQKSTAEISIARQRLARHENNRETVENGNLYSVRPVVIKGGHVINPALSDSVGREFRRQFSS